MAPLKIGSMIYPSNPSPKVNAHFAPAMVSLYFSYVRFWMIWMREVGDRGQLVEDRLFDGPAIRRNHDQVLFFRVVPEGIFLWAYPYGEFVKRYTLFLPVPLVAIFLMRGGRGYLRCQFFRSLWITSREGISRMFWLRMFMCTCRRPAIQFLSAPVRCWRKYSHTNSGR